MVKAVPQLLVNSSYETVARRFTGVLVVKRNTRELEWINQCRISVTKFLLFDRYNSAIYASEMSENWCNNDFAF